MSYKNFMQALELIKLNHSHYGFAVSQSDFNIKEVERILTLKLPNSYKEFLKKFGYLDFGSQEIFGITNKWAIDKFIYGDILSMTLDQRKINDDPSFPLYLIPIHALGNGELSCLDTSQMNEEGECPVVAWYFGATLPNGKLEVLAEDFGAFLLEKVQCGLESLEEDGVKVNK